MSTEPLPAGWQHPVCPGYVAWEIVHGASPDDCTHVCRDHLHRMLSHLIHGAMLKPIIPTVGPPSVSADKRAGLKCCYIEKDEETVALFLRINRLENQIEQLRVQMAGCSVAATGYIKGENACKPGQYGWSRGYEDVKTLYLKYDQAYKALRKIEEIAAEAHPWIALRVQEGLKEITTS